VEKNYTARILSKRFMEKRKIRREMHDRGAVSRKDECRSRTVGNRGHQTKWGKSIKRIKRGGVSIQARQVPRGKIQRHSEKKTGHRQKKKKDNPLPKSHLGVTGEKRKDRGKKK